jgi:hypothetical protein
MSYTNLALASRITSPFCPWFSWMADNAIALRIQTSQTLGPEVGSRAMQRLVIGTDISLGGWIVVQEGRYRYNASICDGCDVRIVINEYLACHVCWE